MIVTGFWIVFFIGFCGGIAAEFVGWFELRTAQREEFPKYIRYWWYWFLTFVMAAFGGLLTTAYGTENVKVLLGLNIGASAPLMLVRFR